LRLGAHDCIGSGVDGPGAATGTTPAEASVILPMGILPIEAINQATGAVLSGPPSRSRTPRAHRAPSSPAQQWLVPGPVQPADEPVNPTSYSMPTTGVDGLSRIAVIYGTYVVTVTSAGGTHATTTVTVNPTAIVVGGSTYYMPAFVPVPD